MLFVFSFHLYKVVEIGEKNRETHKTMLLKAYGYLGGYEANITKDYQKSLNWFEKYQAMDKDNADVTRYVDMLKKMNTGRSKIMVATRLTFLSCRHHSA